MALSTKANYYHFLKFDTVFATFNIDPLYYRMINITSSFHETRGTSYEVWGNCNAPKAITLSAVIYSLRCMVGHDVPLNQVGLLHLFIKFIGK